MTYANDTHATFARILQNLGAHFSAEFSEQNERFDTQNFREQDGLDSDFCELLKALFDINASKANADDLREIGENPAEFFAQSALFSAPHFDFENALLYYTNTDLSDIAPASTGHKNIGFTLVPCASHKRADLANATRAINKAIANYNIIFFVGEDSSLRGGKAIHAKNSVNLNQNSQKSVNSRQNSQENSQIQSENSRPHLSIAFATRRFSRQTTLKKDIVEKIIIIKDINLRAPSLAQLLNLEKLHREFASTLAHAKAQPIALDEFYARVIEIFSISALNSEFYAEIVRIFNALWHECKFPQNTSESDKRAFCLRLICRLLFCKFLEKKGLIDERLWNTKLAQDYYHELLEPLFFATLNTPQNERDYLSYGILGENSAPTCHSEPAKAGEESTPYKESVNLKMDSSHSANAQNDETNATSAQNSPNLQALLNAIPYLNGGLFAAQKNDFFNPQNPVQNRGILSVPNALIAEFFTLLSRYHFSIDEGSVNVQIVGLNPELLGLVFENLLAKLSSEQDEAALAKSLQSDIEDFEKSQKSEKNPKNSQRKATGSYYTPREIVSFMVRESLFAYLCRATKIHAEKLRGLIFDENFAENSQNLGENSTQAKSPALAEGDLGGGLNSAETSAILSALKSLKILDPACGSGAFPMGILNEILALQERLGDTRTPHARKLEALQSCIYGIDIQPMATEIARLRCFLSLIIDENPHDIKPLPNLEFKFMQGNSLLESLSVGDSMLEIIPKDYLAPQKMGLFDESEIKSAKDLSLFDEKDYKHLQGLFVRYFSANKASAKAGLKNEILDLMRQVFDKRQADFESEIEALNENLKAANSTNAKKYANQITDLMGAGAALQSLLHDYATRNFASDKLFLYRFFFAEVMQNGGFDIVIGNPPYIRQEKIPQKAAILAAFKPSGFANSTADIYTYFFAKGLEVLCAGGVLSFITSNKFTRAGYGANLRTLLLRHEITHFIDLNGVKVFDNATVDTAITSVRKVAANSVNSLPNSAKNSQNSATNGANSNLTAAAAQNATINSATPTATAAAQNSITYLPLNSFADFTKTSHIADFLPRASAVPQATLTPAAFIFAASDTLALKSKIEQLGTPLKEWDIAIYRGILTGYNDAFIIDTATKDEILRGCADDDERERTAALIKPILRGRDIKRYSYEWAGLWIIGTFPALRLDIADYPALKNYLEKFMPRIAQSGEKGCRKKTANKWFETQDNIAYHGDFEKEKIVYPNMNKEFLATLDKSGFYTNQKCFFITSENENLAYLTGILNSNLNFWYFRQIGATLGAGGYEMSKIFVEKLPIPKITPQTQAIAEQIVHLVEQILQSKKQGKDTSEFESQINSAVYALYALTPTETTLIERK